MHTIRYFGWYSNKARGVRAKHEANQDEVEEVVINDDDTPYRKLCRSRWAALIRKVYELDPLCCPKCGGEMRFIAFLDKKDQADIIERILRYCDLWRFPESRGPPDVRKVLAELVFLDETRCDAMPEAGDGFFPDPEFEFTPDPIYDDDPLQLANF